MKIETENIYFTHSKMCKTINSKADDDSLQSGMSHAWRYVIQNNKNPKIETLTNLIYSKGF